MSPDRDAELNVLVIASLMIGIVTVLAILRAGGLL